MSTNATLFYRSIEDYLGPGEQRFLSSGYRRANYRIGDIAVTPGDESDADVQGIASVVYPPRGWSTKGDQTDLRPHLSTVDTLVIGTQLSEIYLVHTYGFDENIRRNMRLCKVTLKAGSTPQENLIDIPLAAKLRTTKPLPDNENRCISIIDCHVGFMRARCEIEHHVAPPVNLAGRYHSVEDILGPAMSRYYGEGFKTRKQRIEDVQVDMETLQSEAQVHIESIQGISSGTEGIHGRYQPSVSMIDCLVVIGQMAQVMMYELDAVRRQDSNTLWVRQAVLEEVVLPPAGVGTLEVLSVGAWSAIRSRDLLHLGDSVWRTLGIVGHCGGIATQISFAHALPAPIQV